MSNSLRPHGLYSPWNSPRQNTGVGSLSLLPGIFPTQGLNPGLPRCGRILYRLSHQGSPRILEWVACPFSCGSFQPRNRTGVSCFAGRFFTNWVILCGSQDNKLWKILKEMGILAHLTCLMRNLYAGQEAELELDMNQLAGSKLGKVYIKAVYCHPAYLTYM